MASIKITKKMAEDAAHLITSRLYGKKIIEANNELVEYCDKLVNKYVPRPVISVTEEYGRYFSAWKNIRIYHGVCSRDMPISRYFPSATGIEITKEEYDKVLELKSKVYNLNDRKKQDYNQWCSRLKGLGTLKKMQEFLPEAVEYVNWPCVNALPSVNYDKERAILKLAKKLAEDED